MIRFAICDDDQEMAGYLECLIMSLSTKYIQDFEVSIYYSGEAFCEYVNKANKVFDIVLMDIEMKDLTGVEAGKRLRENIAHDRTLLIFISSHTNYYHEIIDLNVFCFIVKPIFVDEYNLKLDRAIKRIIHQQEQPQSLTFIFQQNHREIHIPIYNIMYFVSNARQIHLHTISEVNTYYGRLDIEAKKLPKYLFSRIHKSYLIHFTQILSITAKDVIMKDNQQFPISEKYRDAVKVEYIRYRSIHT